MSLVDDLKNNQIDRLNISGYQQNEDALNEMLDALEQNQSVRIVNLAGTNITADHARRLAKLLADPENQWTRLDLSRCKLGASVIDIAHALLSNQSLQQLNLSDVSMANQSGYALAHALHENKTLKALEYSNNSRMNAACLASLDQAMLSRATNANEDYEKLLILAQGLRQADSPLSSAGAGFDVLLSYLANAEIQTKVKAQVGETASPMSKRPKKVKMNLNSEGQKIYGRASAQRQLFSLLDKQKNLDAAQHVLEHFNLLADMECIGETIETLEPLYEKAYHKLDEKIKTKTIAPKALPEEKYKHDHFFLCQAAFNAGDQKAVLKSLRKADK